MTRDFSGAVALVTGGGAGIGAAQVKLLRARGATVCAVDIDEEAAQSSGADLAIGADVADREAMAAAVDRVLERFGRLDVVFCTAGITHLPATVRSLKPGEAQRVIEVNLIGTLNTIEPAIEPLIAARGHIVVVSSMGWPPNTEYGTLLPAVGGVAYSTSKTAVEMLGRGLRMELSQYGVGVTITYFGPIDTAMGRLTLSPAPKAKERITVGPEKAAVAVLRAVERGKVRAIIPARWNFLNIVRPLGVHLDNLLLRSKTQREFIRTYDSG
ncbi:SDR family NAD(P)-dependent oxidoreductase [Mycolicibacterium litorale]|uniref:SDR family NAD(P)-dependent oxidoreductase n=1 Tax=Mycolicibacterium litorale TaxID=758802 RepID=UPI001065C999|nr:SDR family NAD(P)-dependent oxidoreductase [Mycolicibacterium litorale]MCV7413688.1 SDR family NAD(P)-dependent oxidoreductase [Mycolicibacterium litorale]